MLTSWRLIFADRRWRQGFPSLTFYRVPFVSHYFGSTLRQARLIKPCTGILIYGPPGCGKTLLAQAVAKQSGAAFISVKASTLMRRSGVAGGMGGSDAAHGRAGYSNVMVRAVFSLAQKIQPCIIFLDEADGLCFKREEGDAGTDR